MSMKNALILRRKRRSPYTRDIHAYRNQIDALKHERTLLVLLQLDIEDEIAALTDMIRGLKDQKEQRKQNEEKRRVDRIMRNAINQRLSKIEIQRLILKH